MKKFILSLGVIAALSTAFVFTSCKDDKEPEQEVVVNNDAALKAVAAQTGGQVQGDKVVVKNADGSTTTYSYTYTVDGQTYTSLAALQQALANKAVGSTASVVATLVSTTTSASGQTSAPTVVSTATSSISMTDGNAVEPIKFPTTGQPVNGTVTINEGHSGGRV